MNMQVTPRVGGKLGRYPNTIRRYRIQSGLSQRKLAALTGHSRSTISAWERGHVLPSLANALQLAKTLGALIETLYHELYSTERPSKPQTTA